MIKYNIAESYLNEMEFKIFAVNTNKIPTKA